MKTNPQSAEHADKIVQVIKTWLSERDDKHIIAWILADRLRQYSSAHGMRSKATK